MEQVQLHDRLKLVYTQTQDGNIDIRFGTKKEVRENRDRLFESFGIKPNFVIEAQQVHSDLILTLIKENSKMWRGKNITGIDGFITDQTHIALMLRVADCVPLVLYDPQHHTLGMFHVGWRGAAKNIHLTGLDNMIQEYDTDPNQVLAWIGPSAQKCHYRSKDQPDQLDDEKWQDFIEKDGSKWAVDVPGYIEETLNNEGVYKKNMSISSICTIENENLFSHQRAQDSKEPEGRFAVIAQLK